MHIAKYERIESGKYFSTTLAHVDNTSSTQLTKPKTQNIPQTSEYSDKDSEVTAKYSLDVSPLPPPSSSEETTVYPCPYYTVMRKKVMIPRDRGLKKRLYATDTWLSNKKVALLVCTLVVGGGVLFKEGNGGL